MWGRSGTKRIACGLSVLPSWVTMAASIAARRASSGATAGAEDDEDDQRLAFERVGHADGGGLEHGGVAPRRRLHLGGADALARHLDRVVGAAQDVPEAVGVHPRPVAMDPDAGHARPVGVQIARASGSCQKPRVMPGQGPRGSPVRPPRRAPARPSASTTSAAMPGTGALNAQGLSGSSGLQPRMPPETSVPPE